LRYDPAAKQVLLGEHVIARDRGFWQGGLKLEKGFNSCVSGPDAPLLRAARRQPTSHTPVWLMRQAGRYLPEYRAMRERYGFLELARNPAAAAEVTLQPIERLGIDAAILFADILLIVEPLGVGLEFSKGEGPLIRRPVRSEAEIARLGRIDVESAVPFVFDAVGRVK
jgi:uroporphyrinogen decarboxylase